MQRGILAVSLTFLLWHAPTLAEGLAFERKPVPPVDKLKEAEALIRDLFQEEFRKTSMEDKRAFAAKLLQQGLATHDDMAARYQLLDMARELAGKTGDINAGLTAVDAMKSSFKVDGSALKLEVLRNSERYANSKEIVIGLAQHYLQLGEEAVAAEDFSTAQTCASNAEKYARLSKDVNLFAKASERIKDYQERRLKFDAVRAARKKLFEMPDDPAANFEVGKYYALVNGDWEKGLPSLAKASDPKWKEAAVSDLAKPEDSANQLKVADLWYELSSKFGRSEADSIKARAAHWYGQAVTQLNGLTRTKVERRLEELQPAVAEAKKTMGGMGPIGVSAATREAMPTEAELAKLKELFAATLKGDDNDRSSYYSEQSKLTQRLAKDPRSWSDADFKMRREAELKIKAVDSRVSTTHTIAYGVYSQWHEYAGSSKNEAQFLARAKDAEGDYGKYYARFTTSNQLNSWDTKMLSAMNLYLENNKARFATPAAKIAFCDWLKSNGITSEAVKVFKEKLQGK